MLRVDKSVRTHVLSQMSHAHVGTNDRYRAGETTGRKLTGGGVRPVTATGGGGWKLGSLMLTGVPNNGTDRMKLDAVNTSVPSPAVMYNRLTFPLGLVVKTAP